MKVTAFSWSRVSLCLILLCCAATAQQPELVIQTGESRQVVAITFSPDGKALVSGGTRARLWDVEAGREVGIVSDLRHSIAVAGSVRANLIALGGMDGTIKLLDGTTRKEKAGIQGGAQFVGALALDAEGKILAGAIIDDTLSDSPRTTIKIWDLAHGKAEKTLASYDGLTASLSLSPDGTMLAANTGTGNKAETLVWNLVTGAVIRSFVVDKEGGGELEQIYSIAFSPDGTLLASGSEEGVLLVNVRSGSTRTFGKETQIYSVAFSPDGKVLATGDDAERVVLWEVAGGRELWSNKGHESEVLRVAFSPDGRTLASVGSDSTIKLWDVASGRVTRTFGRYASIVTDCMFNPEDRTLTTLSMYNRDYGVWDLTTGRKEFNSSPRWLSHFSKSGRWLLGFDDETEDAPEENAKRAEGKRLRVWDLSNGKLFYSLTSPQLDYMGSGDWAFSNDDTFLAFAKADATVVLLNLNNKRETVLSPPPINSDSSQRVTRVSFSPDGRVLSVSYINAIKLWRTADGLELKTFPASAGGSLSFSPDGKKFVVRLSGETGVTVWDLSGDTKLNLKLGSEIAAVTFSADGKKLVLHDRVDTFWVWNLESGKELHRAKHPGGVSSSVISPDNTKLATGSSDGTVILWELATGKVLHTFKTLPAAVEHLEFQEGGRLFSIYRMDESLLFWDTAANREETFGGLTSISATRSDSANLFAVGGAEGAKVFELSTGKLLHSFRDVSGKVMPENFSPDGRTLLYSTGYDLKLWDFARGVVVWTIPGTTSFAISVSFSHDGAHVLTGGNDGYARIWDARSGALVARLVELGESDWAVVTPDGRFDASAGAFELMYWRIGSETITFNQLKERYYEPGLLAKVMGQSREALRDITALKDVKLHPAVTYEMAGPGSYRLKVGLTNRGGGIGPVQVFVNGKEAVADARDARLKANPQAPRAELTVDLKNSHATPGQANSIRVYAWNYDERSKRGYISSQGAELTWVPPGTASRYDPEMYALIVGVSEYAGASLRLLHAAKDAEVMARAVSLAGQGLFPDKVHIKLLSSLQTQPGDKPTKENIRRAFEEFRRARPGDVFFIYLAGHGVTLGNGSDSYLFLTQEARSPDVDVLADEGVRQQTAITGEELVSWINQVPARRNAMVLDTCASAAFAKQYRLRALPGDAVRAIEKLKDRTGFHILMGSAANANSYEANDYGQGLLTYALLQGMRGAALAPGGEVDVQTIFQYAANRVPALSRDIGSGIQRPEIKVPWGGLSFPLGWLSEEARRNIPLSSAKPVILRPVILAEKGGDPLRLRTQVGDALREASYPATRGGAARLVYVEVDDMPDAFIPYGRYTVSGVNVQVAVTLERNGEVVATFTVEGRREDLAGVSNNLVEAVIKSARPFVK